MFGRIHIHCLLGESHIVGIDTVHKLTVVGIPHTFSPSNDAINIGWSCIDPKWKAIKLK